MNRFPVIRGGRTVELEDAKGVMFDEPPEMEAFQRWQQGDFLEIERLHARKWRDGLAQVDLKRLQEFVKNLGDGSTDIHDLPEAREWARRTVAGYYDKTHILQGACVLLGVSPEHWSAIMERWNSMGQPPLQEFAPYAAHVLAVEVFFFLAVGANLIGTSDPKNRVDIAYLHYLPFCMVFVSSDNLHARCAPLFMGEDQSFVDGAAMKSDLAKLDAHYSKLPDEVKDRGVMSFAPCPPLEGGFLTSDLWDKHLPSWRKQAERPSKLSEEAVQKIQKKIKEMVEAAESSSVGTQPSDVSNATQTVIRRRVPTRKGKWRIVPPEVEEEAGKE